MRHIRPSIVIPVLVLLLMLGCQTSPQTTPQATTIDLGATEVKTLVGMMTIEEKVGQITQVDRRYLDDVSDIKTLFLGSLLSGGGGAPEVNTPESWANTLDEYQDLATSTRLGIPLIYGIDAVHGHNNVIGATIVPHNIGLGATRNPELVKALAEMTAREVRATGINWNFAPCVANARDERWGRTYESFGEDIDLITELGRAQTEGFQGQSLDGAESIAACVKHYLGDGAAEWATGVDGKIDRGNTTLDESELRDMHMKPYISAIEAGAATIMASYNSWQGALSHGNEYLLTDVLKGELGFTGFVVSDWSAIDALEGDYKSDIIWSINAGIDMIMVPGDLTKSVHYKEFVKLCIEAVKEGSIPMTRLDDAVTRILNVKKDMGLLNGAHVNDRQLLPTIGSDAHRELSRQAVRESLVLLKNDGLLPLDKGMKKVILAGRGADNVGMQCGGWSISWQGGMGDITPGTSILEGVKAMVSDNTEVIHTNDGQGDLKADAVIVVVGENPYAEFAGDDDDLSLYPEDLELIQKVKDSGTPFVIVLLSGRPMIINSSLESSNAFIAAWLPGTEGNGITDVLFGDYAPTGKLSMTWPASMDQIPINAGDEEYEPLFSYGYGLSY